MLCIPTLYVGYLEKTKALTSEICMYCTVTNITIYDYFLLAVGNIYISCIEVYVFKVNTTYILVYDPV